MRQLLTLVGILLVADMAVSADVPADWAFKPVKRPAVPGVATGSTIDSFLLEQLKSKNLNFTPATDRPTLLRRVTFDLTGLPPTLKELQDFLTDNSPNAFDKVVDRLLNSPAY